MANFKNRKSLAHTHTGTAQKPATLSSCGQRKSLDGLWPFPPFVLGAISTDKTSRNVKLYTFGTRMLKTTQSLYHLRAASIRKPHGLLTISMWRLWRLHDDCTISIQSLYGLCRALPGSLAKIPYKKWHVARVQCKHIPLSHLQCLKNRTENHIHINHTASRAYVIQA